MCSRVSAGVISAMKLKKHFGQVLVVVGISLLALYAAAKLHEFILSRVVIRRFEERKPATLNKIAKDNLTVQPPAAPDFVSWSKQRIKQYEESFSKQLAPPLAVIRIGRIHVQAPVLEGTDDLMLNRGVGHIAGTARLGEGGNIGIAGHRDGFFRGLKDIKVGDRVELEGPDRTETYIVSRLEVVSPKDVSVLRSSGEPTLTLVTCYPFYYIGKAPQRFIVHASLAGSDSQTRANAISN
jgi:sortase A